MIRIKLITCIISEYKTFNNVTSQLVPMYPIGQLQTSTPEANLRLES